MVLSLQTEHSKGSLKMNEVLVKLEELKIEDLIYILEYLTDLIGEKKRIAEREKRLKRKNKCKEKNLKQ